jgi:hypothetical protein
MLLLENKDFREFVGLLNSSGVKFLVVCGHAVALHGYPRFTGDLDVWIATDLDNAARVVQVLQGFGFGGLKLTVSDFTQPGYAIQLGRPPYRIDILTSIDAVDFGAAYERRLTVEAGGLQLPFISLEDLLANKRATGRPQDKSDVARLEAKRRPGRDRTQHARPRPKRKGA